MQPEDDERLREGDVLALSGSQEAVREAALLLGRPRRDGSTDQGLRSVRAT